MALRISTLIAVVLFFSAAYGATITFSTGFGDTQPLGTSQIYTVSIDPNFYNVSIAFVGGDAYTITPSIFNFTVDVTAINFTFTAISAGFQTITFVIDGDQGIDYTAFNVYKNLVYNTLSFVGGYAVYPTTYPVVKVPTNPFALYLSRYPTNGVTVTASSDPPGSIVFSQTTFAFDATEKHYTFSYTAQNTGDEFGNVVLTYTFSGPDAAYYSPLNTTIQPALRSVIPSDSYVDLKPVKVNEESEAIRLSLDYPPPTGVTLTPYSDSADITFSPPKLDFLPSVNTLQFTYTATQPGEHIISWTFSGVDAALYGAFDNISIFIGVRPFVVVAPTKLALVAGQASDVFTVSTQYPPESDVNVLLTLTYTCTLGTPLITPSTLSFLPTILSNTFAISSNVLCSSITITATLSGTDKDKYVAPAFSSVLSFGKLTVSNPVNTNPAFPGTLYCGDSTSYTLSVTTPPPNGFSLALSSPGATFVPPTLTFTPTTTTVGYTVTSNFLQTIFVHFTASGADVPLLNVVADKPISVGGKTIYTLSGNNYVTPGEGALFAGSVSDQVSIEVDFPPATDVTVTPSAEGLVFDPPSITFTPQDSSKFVTVTGEVAGTYTVTYTLSGTDAGCYSLDVVTTTITVSKLSVTVTPGTLAALIIGKWSNPYTVSIDNLPNGVTITPTAVDVNNLPVSTYSFKPISLTLTPAAPSATFVYLSSVRRPNTDKIVFQLSGADADIVALRTINVGASLARTFTTPAHLVTNYVGNFLPAVFVVNIESSEFVVTIDDAPPTDVSLRITAPNTLFTPDTLLFNPTTKSATFSLTTTDGAGNSADNGLLKTITWTVEGTDAALYGTPTTSSFYAVLRPIKVASVGDLTANPVFIGTPITFTITTPYAPTSDLTFTFSAADGAFTLASSAGLLTTADVISKRDTAVVTLAAGDTATSFTATPLLVGNNFVISSVISGDDVADYAALPDIVVSTKKSSFLISLPAGSAYPLVLSYDFPAYVYNIRPLTPPTTSVTLNIYSQQVTIDPAEITFTPTSLSQDVYVVPIFSTFSPSGSAVLSPGVALSYVVSGPDANSYAPPADSTFVATLSSPPRTLTVDTPNLRVGTGGAPSYLTISSPVPPLDSVTITPTTPQDPNYAISPPSVTLTPTLTTATFTITRTTATLPATPTVRLILGVSGPDAFLYADTPVVTLNPTTGTISTPQLYDGLALTVNLPFQTTITLSEAPTATLTVTPQVALGQQITFSPTPVTFQAGQLSTSFSLTPQQRGTARITFTLGGDAATAYAFKDDYDVTIAAGTISFNPNNWAFSVGGQTKQYTAILSTPALNGFTLTPTGPGLTFNPPAIAFAAGAFSATFSVTATQYSLAGSVTTALSGPDADAGFYTNPYPTPGLNTISNTKGVVTATATSNPNTYLKQTVTFSLNAGSPTLPLIITPSAAAGVTFSPASVSIIDSTVTTASVDVISTAAGVVTITFALSGAGATFFIPNPNALTAPVTATFYAYPISITPPATLPAGVVSDVFKVTIPTLAAPVDNVAITPSASIDGVVFIPPYVNINSTNPSATFAYQAPAAGSFIITYALSGPGATSYAPIPYTSITAAKATFSLPSYDNSLVAPTNAPFPYGVWSQTYTITARSVPGQVQLELVSDQLDFNPKILTFTPTYQTAQFSFIPKKVGAAQIRYNLLGVNASLYSPIGPTDLRTTYKVTIGAIPTLNVGVVGGSFISIEPAPLTTFAVDISQSPANPDLVFSPTRVVFTSTSTTQAFSVLALNGPTIARPLAYNIPGSIGSIAGSTTNILLTGTDALDNVATSIPLLQPAGVIVAPGIFTILHPRYQMDVTTTIKVTISVEPRADVTLSLFANNLNFNPPYFVFTKGGPTTQTIEVTPRHATSYELDYAAFKVDYYVSGTNAGDYWPPSETFHYFALPMGYIAALVIVPLVVLIVIIVVIVLVVRGGSK